MTISVTTRKSTPAVGDSANKTWPFTFKTLASDTIVPYLIDSAGAAVAITTNYSISLNADQDTSPGGSMTYPVTGSAITSSYSIMLVRVTPKTQVLDLTYGGNFSEENIEDALDRMAMQIQELQETQDRCLKLPVHDVTGNGVELPAYVADRHLAVNTAGDGLTLTGALDAAVSVTSYVENNILDKTSGAAILSEIGGISLASDNVFTGKVDFQSTVSLYQGTAITVADVTAGALALPDDGNYYQFTDGTDFATINALGGSAPIIIQFTAGGNLITHSAVNMALPGNADILTEAGDVAVFIERNVAGRWICVSYQRDTGVGIYGADVVTPGNDYSGLVITRPSVSTVTVAAAELVVRHKTTGVPIRLTSVSQTPDITNPVGVDSLDSGVESADQWYQIWVIYNATTADVSAVFTTNLAPLLPTLPSGYDYAALVGSVRNTGGDFVDFTQYNENVFWAAPVGLKAGSFTTGAWTSQAMGAHVPGQVRRVRGLLGVNGIEAGVASSANGADASILRAGATGSSTFGGLLPTARTIVHSWEVQTTGTIWYYVDNANADLVVTGYSF